MDPKNVDCCEERSKSLRARYIYAIIFFTINLTAWFIRDYGHSVFPPTYYKEACGTTGHDCFHTLGVLRVSLGCFIFFFLMFLTTFIARKLYEACSKWHSGWWKLKFFLLLASMVVPFFIPPGFIHIYGEVARVGAGIFLLLQLISVIEFIRWWNKYWSPDEQSNQRYKYIQSYIHTYFLMNHFLHFLQELLHCIIYLNSVLWCFHMWNCVYVLFLRPKTSMFSQHILHHMDCPSAHSYDGYILAFKGCWRIKFLYPMSEYVLGTSTKQGLIEVYYLQELWLLMLFSSVGLPLEVNQLMKNVMYKSQITGNSIGPPYLGF
ncbi:serine incorporator 3 isoform X4 [Gossypium hirsutum]|uniref:Serine incorporator 3 isoform X4 n=1 Tax=Gossypium hirsutum TaxID=3635 RepID=A0ABM3AQN6_GOSHI|nr:serine incorporator 3 isoform X4 [Gossypium hirsutum]